MTGGAHRLAPAGWRVALAAAVALPLAVAPVGPALAAGESGLAGGEATGRGLFVTYSDRDTVIEGGTVAPPDVSSPLAHAALDRTGLGSALASVGYSPYSDGAGVINAFAGTELPVGALSESSRAKVTGRPPQEQHAAVPGTPGWGARARLSEGPAAEATALIAALEGSGLGVRVGDVTAGVRRSGPTAGSVTKVVLRSVSVADVLTIEAVVLTATATADGAAGKATASALVEGVTVAGVPVRLTPVGLEPAGPASPDLSALADAGVEILAAGESAASPGGPEAKALARGPVLRFRTDAGRVLTVVLGEALARSTFAPGA